MLDLDTAIKKVLDGEDSDAVYDALCPERNQPGTFRLRLHRGALTSAEMETIDVDALFESAHPEHISRLDFRDAVKAAREGGDEDPPGDNDPGTIDSDGDKGEALPKGEGPNANTNTDLATSLD